jgi:para-aminobenzoate synthetase component I
VDRTVFINALNSMGRRRVPFLFVIDFEMENCFASPLDEIDPKLIRYNFQGFSNTNDDAVFLKPVIEKIPISFREYQKRFDSVMSHLNRGDSFLTNLTIKTEVKTNLSLEELYQASRAKYKLFFENKFIVFSPEPFIQIKNDRILSFPMKGTIDAAVPNAKNVILNDPKELSEHITIVDLIRNDLSQVANRVEVTKFRYVEELKTSDKILLQVSSEITGQLEGNYWSRIGDILISLLPAGSISGAPKSSTVAIIRASEGEKRGYYTGVCGYFDGTSLDSAVMIRFVENTNGSLYYRSGGGITAKSIAIKEYQEAIEKIYVPVD